MLQLERCNVRSVTQNLSTLNNPSHAFIFECKLFFKRHSTISTVTICYKLKRETFMFRSTAFSLLLTLYQATGAAEDCHHVNFSFKRSRRNQRWTMALPEALYKNVPSYAEWLLLSPARYQSQIPSAITGWPTFTCHVTKSSMSQLPVCE